MVSLLFIVMKRSRRETASPTSSVFQNTEKSAVSLEFAVGENLSNALRFESPDIHGIVASVMALSAKVKRKREFFRGCASTSERAMG